MNNKVYEYQVTHTSKIRELLLQKLRNIAKNRYPTKLLDPLFFIPYFFIPCEIKQILFRFFTV
jgi:hypothetical protein